MEFGNLANHGYRVRLKHLLSLSGQARAQAIKAGSDPIEKLFLSDTQVLLPMARARQERPNARSRSPAGIKFLALCRAFWSFSNCLPCSDECELVGLFFRQELFGFLLPGNVAVKSLRGGFAPCRMQPWFRATQTSPTSKAVPSRAFGSIWFFLTTPSLGSGLSVRSVSCCEKSSSPVMAAQKNRVGRQVLPWIAQTGPPKRISNSVVPLHVERLAVISHNLVAVHSDTEV